jgi:hypothetical protein
MVPSTSQNTVGVCKQITLLILYHITGSSRLVTHKSLIPLYKPLIFLILLLVSSSSILALRYSFVLFLKCLLAIHLALFRVSTLLWFGSCNHCILACFLWSENHKHSSSKHVLRFFNSYRPKLSSAEVLIPFQFVPKSYLCHHLHLSSPRLNTCLRF